MYTCINRTVYLYLYQHPIVYIYSIQIVKTILVSYSVLYSVIIPMTYYEYTIHISIYLYTYL